MKKRKRGCHQKKPTKTAIRRELNAVFSKHSKLKKKFEGKKQKVLVRAQKLANRYYNDPRYCMDVGGAVEVAMEEIEQNIPFRRK